MMRYPTIHLCSFLIVLTVALLGASTSVYGDDRFPDPHGDEFGTASPVSVGTTVNGSIEVDIDRDWFSFTAERFTTYTIEATPTGLWDANLAAYAFHGQVPLGTTSSVGAASASLEWVNTSYEMTVYVDVSGFAKFTIGSYDLVVSAQPLPDSDGDGLTDDFEFQYFGGNSALPGQHSDSDGFTNLEEQWLGTDPTSGTSGLFITSMVKDGASNDVTWVSRSGLVYELEYASGLENASWDGVATVLGSGPSTTITDPAGMSDRFYRVRVKDVPDLHADDLGAASILEEPVHGAVDVVGDEDWFRFTAEEDVQYTMRLTPLGAWDAQLAAWILGGELDLGSKQGSDGMPLELQWANKAGSPKVVHVQVSGAGTADVGLYELEVIAKPFTDSEPDGLPDAWETAFFASLAQGPNDDFDLDGFTNAEEKKLGTNPADPASGLFLTALETGGGSNRVTWLAAPLRQYKVQATSGMNGGWTSVGTVTGMGPTASLSEPGATTQRFYRVMFTP